MDAGNTPDGRRRRAAPQPQSTRTLVSPATRMPCGKPVTASSRTDDATFDIPVLVKVCDTAISLEDNCTRYGSNIYKPTGLIQNNADKLRFAAFSYLNDLDIKRVLPFESGLHAWLKDKHAALLQKLESDKAMDKDAEGQLTAAVEAFKKTFA